jgi:hypothetical protein
MSDQAKVDRGSGTSRPFVLPNMTDATRLQMETWFKEQAALLDETQKALAAWLARRQEAMEATSRTFQAMLGCKDVGAMAAAYGEWLTGSMNRIVADMNDARDEALRLADFGQNSMAALMQQSAEAASMRTTTPPTAAETETPRTKGAPRAESTHEAGQQRAAE